MIDYNESVQLRQASIVAEIKQIADKYCAYQFEPARLNRTIYIDMQRISNLIKSIT